MTERSLQHVAMVNDDTNTDRAVRNVDRLPWGKRVNVQTIFTDDPNYPPVKEWVARNVGWLREHEGGAHISLMTGRFEKDEHGLFGLNGKLHTMLHRIEDLHHVSPVLGRTHDKQATLAFQKYQHHIRNEVRRQIDVATGLLGVPPAYLSYHFGQHYFGLINTAYEDVARERGIPFRRAQQYLVSRSPGEPHLSFQDRLNHPGVTPNNVLAVLGKIRRKRQPSEICIHVGDFSYGEDQVRAFLDWRVKQAFREFVIDMPHAILRAMQPKS